MELQQSIKLLGDHIRANPQVVDTFSSVVNKYHYRRLIEMVEDNTDKLFSPEEVQYIKDSVKHAKQEVFFGWVVEVIGGGSPTLPYDVPPMAITNISGFNGTSVIANATLTNANNT
jgi:hypothetical protein